MHKQKLALHAKLQLSDNSYAICWQSEARVREFHSTDSITRNSRFLLHLLPLNLNNTNNNVFDKKNITEFFELTTLSSSNTNSLTKNNEDLIKKDEYKYGKIIRSEYTSASCHLFRELPRENCCRVVIIEQHNQNISNTENEIKNVKETNNKKNYIDNDKLFVNITLEKIQS